MILGNRQGAEQSMAKSPGRSSRTKHMKRMDGCCQRCGAVSLENRRHEVNNRAAPVLKSQRETRAQDPSMWSVRSDRALGPGALWAGRSQRSWSNAASRCSRGQSAMTEGESAEDYVWELHESFYQKISKDTQKSLLEKFSYAPSFLLLRRWGTVKFVASVTSLALTADEAWESRSLLSKVSPCNGDDGIIHTKRQQNEYCWNL